MERATPSVFTAMAPRAVAEKYERFAQQSFVNINRSMSWCPAQACSNFFHARGPVTTVKCSCGMQSWCV